MKIFTFFILLGLIANVAYTQSCLPEGIQFTTQTQIDSFAINNPGCTEIEGAVYIGPSDNITNLDGLSVLTSIGGEVIINLNTVLNNLSGLGNLTSVGEGFGIGGNDALISLSGLDNLTSIGGGLIIGNWLIGGNPILSSLNGLESLTSIRGELVISYNHDLNSLIGLDNIDAASITNLIIINNSSLSTCEVQSICDYLVAPNGEISIYSNAPGCNSPEEVDEACLSHCLPEGITFTTQAQIDSFQIVYPNCSEIEGDIIVSGSSITNLLGLFNLTSIGGNLRILNNDSLSNLDGFDNLIRIDGDLRFGDFNQTGYHGNSSLNSIDALYNLLSIGGDLEFSQNGLLTNLSGLNNLEAISGNFLIVSCPIENLEGLESLERIGGGLSLTATTLANFSGLGHLTTLGGLGIIANNNLIDFTGLNNLNTINGSIGIGPGNPGFGNQSLISLEGLENVSSGSIENIIIQNNFSLSICAVQSMCDYLAAPNGVVVIQHNAPGCNSQQEVEEACASSISENSTLFGIKTQPNPFTTSTTLSYELKEPSTVQLSVFNQLGQLVFQHSEEQQQVEQQLQWKAQDQPEGLYYYQLKAGDQVANGKMVKVR